MKQITFDDLKMLQFLWLRSIIDKDQDGLLRRSEWDRKGMGAGNALLTLNNIEVQ